MIWIIAIKAVIEIIKYIKNKKLWKITFITTK